MADVAQLGIAVDSSQAKSATGDLKGLAAAANTAEQASARLAQSGQKSETTLRAIDAAAKRAGVSTEEMQRRTDAFNASTVRMQAASMSAQKALVSLTTGTKQAANENENLDKKTASTTSTMDKFALRFTRGLIAGAALTGIKEAAQFVWNLNSALAATADTAQRSGVGGQQFQGLQTAAAYKGVGSDAFNAAMLTFNGQVDQAKHGLGELQTLLRSNGKTVSDTATTFGTVADLVKNAGSEAQKFSILQQAGLPATREFAKLMEQGADSITKQSLAAAKLTDAQLDDARRLDERFQQMWVNFTQWGKKAALDVQNGLNNLNTPFAHQGTWLGGKLQGMGFDRPEDPNSPRNQGLNMLRSGMGSQIGQNAANGIYNATGAFGSQPAGKPTFDPALARQQIALEQQRLGLLSPLATAEDVVRQKQLEINAAALNNVSISRQQADSLKLIALAQFEQYRVQQQASIGVFDFAKAQKAANDNLQALVAQKLLDPANVQQWAAATTVAAKSLEQLRDQAALAAAPLEGLKRLELEGSNLRGLTDNAAVSSLNGLSSSLLDITSGTKSAADGFKNLGTTVVRALQEMIIKMTIITPIARGLQSLLGGFVGGGTVSGAIGPTSLGGLPLSFAAADGGTFGPGWGIVGERGPELINVHSRGVTVIPNHISKPYLPGFADGGTLSAAGNVTRMPFGQNNTPKITINNYTDAQPSTETASNGDITISLKKMVNGMIVESIANGDGGRTISQKFGVKPFAGQ